MKLTGSIPTVQLLRKIQVFKKTNKNKAIDPSDVDKDLPKEFQNIGEEQRDACLLSDEQKLRTSMMTNTFLFWLH